ncbi:hypothetical protein CYMTET_11137, partial [Cymbomonas tetramitiformis]
MSYDTAGSAALEKEQTKKGAESGGGGGRSEVTYIWRKLDTSTVPRVESPAGRSGHSSFMLSPKDPRIFFHGGAADSNYFNDIYCFHTESRKWMLCHTYSKPRARAYHTMNIVAPDTTLPKKEQIPRLCLFGGFHKGTIDGEVALIEEWRIMAKGLKAANDVIAPPKKLKDQPSQGQDVDVWVEVETSGDAPLPRCMHSTCMVNGVYMVVFGGWHSNFVNDVYILDTINMVWEFKHATVREGCVPPEPRAGHAAVVLPDTRKLVVFGGQNKSGQLGDLLVLDLNSMEWSRPYPAGRVPPKRSGHSATYDTNTNKIFIYGGWDGVRQRDDLHILNVDGNPDTDWRWESFNVSGHKIGGLCGHTANFVGDKMYVFGGWASGVFYSEVFTLEMQKASKARTKKSAPGQEPASGATAQQDGANEQGQYTEDFSDLASRRKALGLDDDSELTEAQLIQLDRQLEDELQAAYTEIQARNIRMVAQAEEREKAEKRKVAEAAAEARRKKLLQALNSGMTLADAMTLADTEAELENDSFLPSIPGTPHSQSQQSSMGRSNSRTYSQVERDGPVRRKPPPPPAPEPDEYERTAILSEPAPYHKMLQHDDTYQLDGDPLAMIAATGGLNSCYNDDKRHTMIRKQHDLALMETGPGGALTKALREADARYNHPTHTDVLNSGAGFGVEAVPKRPVRPGRHIKLEPQVGYLEDIRDAVVPEQPNMLALPPTWDAYLLS